MTENSQDSLPVGWIYPNLNRSNILILTVKNFEPPDLEGGYYFTGISTDEYVKEETRVFNSLGKAFYSACPPGYNKFNSLMFRNDDSYLNLLVEKGKPWQPKEDYTK